MKTIVIEATQCPSCGKPMPAGALAGLCPACLLAQGLGTDAGGGRSGPFVPPPLEEVAKLFPQLEILGLLGAGGMGAVYKARQPALDRIVALKILPSHNEEGANFAERFNREARALARLSHPNIVAVFEFGQAGALSFFIMEFVDGANLRQLERAGRLAPREALQIIPQICDALQYAHDEGVVHRDIKPENVLVDRKGRVKIADFGLAKILGQDVDSLRLTAEGQVMGTPHYMAPEQIEKPLTVDHRADIYSLGVVLYEMLTGDLPLGKFAPPSRKYQLDVRLDDVVLRALENDPARRYQHASEVKTQVENIAGTPSAPSAPSVPEPSAIRWAGFPLVIEREGVRRVNRKEALKMFGIFFGLLTVAFGLVSVIHGQNLFGWLGIAGSTSLQLRLLVAALVTTFGVWCARRAKPAPVSPPQTPQGTVILSPEKFSRKAIIGACWVPFFFVAAFAYFLVSLVSVAPGAEATIRPTVWMGLLKILLTVVVMLPGALAPFGTTILGWVAVSDIRRLKGRLAGLPLAVFDGLLFPLLILDAFLFVGLTKAVRWIVTELLPAFRDLTPDAISIATVLLCAFVDYLIIRRVWRAVCFEQPASRANRDWWWSRRSGAVAIGLACAGLIMANVWRLEKSAPRAAVQQRLAAPDAQTGTFIAKLPERGTVELLAVSDAGAASNGWWLPNGTPVPDAHYDHADSGRLDFNGWAEKDLVLRWSDLPTDAEGPYVEFDSAGAFNSGGKSWRNTKSFFGTRPVRAAFPPTATEATMRVGFDLAAWETVSTNDRNGNGNVLKTPPGGPNLQAQVHNVGENNGAAHLTILLAKEGRDWKTRVIAVDTNGVEHPEHLGTSTPSGQTSVWSYEFMGLPLARVKEFRVQVRPVHWIEFRGVALRSTIPFQRTAAPANERQRNIASPAPRTQSDYSGARELLEQKPELRFLAWQDEWKTNNFRAARHADGMAVTNETEVRLVRSFSPSSLNVNATEAGKRHPRFLHVWFSHPLFNRHGFVQVAMLDESGQELPGGATSNDARAQDGSPGSVGWLIATFSPGDRGRIPSRVTLRLRYTVGPLERVQTLATDYRGGMSLEGNSQFNGLGQDAEGKTFLAVAVDTGKTRERQFGVVAVLRDGTERDCRGISSMANDGSATRAERFEFDEPLAEIASFRIGSRPVRSMTWENVVLLNAAP